MSTITEVFKGMKEAVKGKHWNIPRYFQPWRNHLTTLHAHNRRKKWISEYSKWRNRPDKSRLRRFIQTTV